MRWSKSRLISSSPHASECLPRQVARRLYSFARALRKRSRRPRLVEHLLELLDDASPVTRSVAKVYILSCGKNMPACRHLCRLLLPILIAGSLRGIEVRHLTLDEITTAADAIVVGAVTDRHVTFDSTTNAVWTEYVVAVSETWKGAPAPQLHLRFFGGTSDGRSEGVVGQPRLEVGVTYLLFIDEKVNVVTPAVGIGQGIFRVERDRLVSGDGEVLELTPSNVVVRVAPSWPERTRRAYDPDPRLSTGAPNANACANTAAASRPATLSDVRHWLVEPATSK